MNSRVNWPLVVGIAGLLTWALWPRRSSAASIPASSLPIRSAASPTLTPIVANPAPPVFVSWQTPAAGRPYQALFDAATVKYGLPPGLLSRMALRESGYNPQAKGVDGEIGIMQIIPKFHPDLGATGAADPAQAIPYAGRFLRYLFDRFHSWTLAVAAYNAGEGNVAKFGGVPPFAVTRAYVAQVLPDVGISQPEPGVLYA